jgi:hypothetical protein
MFPQQNTSISFAEQQHLFSTHQSCTEENDRKTENMFSHKSWKKNKYSLITLHQKLREKYTSSHKRQENVNEECIASNTKQHLEIVDVFIISLTNGLHALLWHFKTAGNNYPNM